VSGPGGILLLGDAGKAHLGDAKGRFRSGLVPSGICVFGVCARGATWEAEPAASGRCLHAAAALEDGAVVAAGEGGGVQVRR